MKTNISIIIFVLLLPINAFGLDNQYQLNGFQIYQYRFAIEGSLGKPFKSGESDQFEWEAYKFDKNSYMIFQYSKKHLHLIYSIQITGKESTMLPFNGLILGDERSKVLEILGKPDEIRDIPDMKLKYYIYEDKNYSVEIDSDGKLYSIKISFYPEIYRETGKNKDYWNQFKTVIAKKDFARLSLFFRPDAEIYYMGNTLNIDKAFASFFLDKKTAFYSALLSETESVYEELKNDTSKLEIRMIEKVGAGFVHKFYSGKFLKEIVFMPYAGQNRIYEIAFKKNSITKQKLPEGWREPLEDEVPDNEFMYRVKDPDRYTAARADFNGDGIIDSVQMLVNDSTGKVGIFAFMSKQGGFKTILLAEQSSLGMGLSVVAPGEYKTACGKGYWKCKEGEPAILALKRPAVNYFHFEGTNSFFVWDEPEKSFKRIWMSD